MQIIGSVTSPYVRFVRAVCEKLGLIYDMELTVYFAKNVAKEPLVKQHNPVMRVPILIDGDRELIESRVIVRYLARLYGTGIWTTAWFDDVENENLLSVIYGLVEAAVLVFNLEKQHPEINREGIYMARSRERIESSLQWLENRPGFGEHFTYVEMFLVCALDWLAKCAVYDWTKHTRIAEIHATFVNEPCLAATRIPADS